MKLSIWKCVGITYIVLSEVLYFILENISSWLWVPHTACILSFLEALKLQSGPLIRNAV